MLCKEKKVKLHLEMLSSVSSLIYYSRDYGFHLLIPFTVVSYRAPSSVSFVLKDKSYILLDESINYITQAQSIWICSSRKKKQFNGQNVKKYIYIYIYKLRFLQHNYCQWVKHTFIIKKVYIWVFLVPDNKIILIKHSENLTNLVYE